MPSGVSAATTVSSTLFARPGSLGHDDDGVRKLVVQTLPRFPEDQQRVEHTHERDQADQPDHEVAQPEDPADRNRRSVLAHDLDAEHLLGERLSVAADRTDRHPAPDDEADE